MKSAEVFVLRLETEESQILKMLKQVAVLMHLAQRSAIVPRLTANNDTAQTFLLLFKMNLNFTFFVISLDLPTHNFEGKQNQSFLNIDYSEQTLKR